MRARMALYYGNIPIEHREVDLKKKPSSLFQYSPKATVPVLVLEDGTVIDESLNIMRWVLTQKDPEHWNSHEKEANTLIAQNDLQFKKILDKYKYSKEPENIEQYWQEALLFLNVLENNLNQHTFLLDDKPTLADYAIFPFIRQFAHVDKTRFYSAEFHKLQIWLDCFLESDIFQNIMKKYDYWYD